MARMPRIVVPGYPHQVTQCGNRLLRTLFHEDDYRYHVKLLGASNFTNKLESLTGKPVARTRPGPRPSSTN